MMPYKIIKSGQPDGAGRGIEKHDAWPVCSIEMDIDAMAKRRPFHATLNKTAIVSAISGLTAPHSGATLERETATPGQPTCFPKIHQQQRGNRRGCHQQPGAQCQGTLPAYGVFGRSARHPQV